MGLLPHLLTFELEFRATESLSWMRPTLVHIAVIQECRYTPLIKNDWWLSTAHKRKYTATQAWEATALPFLGSLMERCSHTHSTVLVCYCSQSLSRQALMSLYLTLAGLLVQVNLPLTTWRTLHSSQLSTEFSPGVCCLLQIPVLEEV